MKTKRWMLFLLLLLSFSSPAWAGDCQSEITAVDDAISQATGLSEAVRHEAQSIRDMAAVACDAGRQAEADMYIQQVLALLSNGQ